MSDVPAGCGFLWLTTIPPSRRSHGAGQQPVDMSIVAKPRMGVKPQQFIGIVGYHADGFTDAEMSGLDAIIAIRSEFPRLGSSF